jgi:signal transduction histidine kinase
LLQHEALRRGLRRANFAWVIIVAVIAVLAFGVVWKAGQSGREAERANRHANEASEQAERAREAAARAEAELWNTRLAEARAIRVAGGPGARVKASQVIANLSRSSGLSETQLLALRTEAIAHLALIDVELPPGWNTQRNLTRPVWDPSYQRRVDGVGSNRIDILEMPSGKVFKSIDGPAGAIRNDAIFSPDGKYLACLFNPAPPLVLAWRIEDGALVVSNRTTSSSGYQKPFFSPDSRTLALYTTRGLELHGLETNLLARIFPQRLDACFSPDSRMMALALGTHAEIRSIATGEILNRIETTFNATHVAWHPGGNRLALSGHEGELAFWELPQELAASERGRLRSLEGHATTIVGLSFSPDGALLLSRAWDGFNSFWEVKSGRRLLAETRAILNNFAADGTQLTAEAAVIPTRSVATLLNRTGFRTVAQAMRTPKLPIGMAFSRNGEWVATDHHDVSCLFETATGRELARFSGRSPIFSADGKSLFACTDRGVFRFDIDTMTSRAGTFSNLVEGVEILHRDRARYPQDRFNHLSLAVDGRTLVIASSEAGVALFDLLGERETRRLTNAVAHFATLTSDGGWLETRFHNGYSHLINLTNATKPSLLGYHLNSAFSPDANWFAITTESALYLMKRNVSNRWVRTARVPLDIGAGDPAPLAFSPDSRSLAVIQNRFDLRLYDVAAARELATFVPLHATPIDGVQSLGFSSDGRFLRAVRRDGEVVEWDLPIVRAELAKLGLNWSDSTPALSSVVPSAHGMTHPATLSKLPVASAPRLSAAFAATAGLLALAAGVFVFIHQRRLLTAYARADELAEDRQRQLALAQNALFQSQKLEALGTLAAGVAHDFNNLLSIIRMSNQLVDRAVKPEGVTKENLQAIEQAVQQGKSIVNSMLGYSRRPTNAIEDFSVATTVSDTVSLLSRQFLSGITFHLDLDPACPSIYGSRLRLEQALLNLIVNASEAMRGHGQLTISSKMIDQAAHTVVAPKSAANYVEVSVTDSGPGISPEIMPRIFEPFFTTKDVGDERGTGLGLSLVYTIAKQDGWGLDVSSEPGKGATFRLLLPVSQTEFLGRRLPTSPISDLSGKVTSL